MIDLQGKLISVLMGGPGNEREVSLKTAESVAHALRQLGADVHEIDVRGPDFVLPAQTWIAFNLIHGTFGEDGQLQAILEQRGVPYTGAGSGGSRIAFDKALTKERFVAAGVPTPQSEIYELNRGQPPRTGMPLVSKPPREGSSVGVSICHTPEDWAKALEQARQYGSHTLIEQFIQGRELTVGILGKQVLPIIHIEPVDGFYDIHNKYPWMAGKGKTLYHCPAELSPEVTQRVQEVALQAFQSCGEDLIYGRVDVMLRQGDDAPFVLEINTIPGMTSSSLLPKAAAAAGIDFQNLCLRIIEGSLASRPGLRPA
jgi:D-alanine-D-alanine ligase